MIDRKLANISNRWPSFPSVLFFVVSACSRRLFSASDLCDSSSPAATVLYCIKAICFTMIAMRDGTHVLIKPLFLLEVLGFAPFPILCNLDLSVVDILIYFLKV